MNKYKLDLNDYKVLANGSKVCRVIYLKDFAAIKAGDKGGYIASEKNLSQEGNACVYGNAWVYGNAYVYDNARVSGNAQVFGDAYAYGDAQVFGDAKVFGNAWVFGNAYVTNRKECINIILPFKHSITITKHHIQIGCKMHKIKDWAKNIKTVGKNNGYSEDETQYIINILSNLLKLRKAQK